MNGEHGLLFLGAGASKPFGPPTMDEYVGGFRTFLEANRFDALVGTYDRISRVLKFFPEGNDLEAIYTVLRDLSRAGTTLDPASTYVLSSAGSIDVPQTLEFLSGINHTDYIGLLSLLQEYIFKSCTIEDEAPLVQSYDPLFEILRGTWWRRSGGGNTSVSFAPGSVPARRSAWPYFPAIPIVTTNYDLAVEIYLNHRGVEFQDGFKRGHGGVMQFEPGELRVQSRSPTVRLIKLHGSIEWKQTEGGRIIQAEGRAGATTARREKISGEVMVFPTRNKSALSWPFLDLLTAFVDSLRQTSFWVVIGYSFRDEVLKQIFLENLTEGKALILMGPHASQQRENLMNVIADSATRENQILALDAEFGKPVAMDLLRGLVAEGL